MCPRLRQVIPITAFLFAGCLLAFPQAGAQNSPQPVRVLWSDIGNKVQIIGRLGKPMKTMMTLRGEWRYPAELEKSSTLDFYVSHLDENALPQSLRFREFCIKQGNPDSLAAIKPTDGEVWECRGCETCLLTPLVPAFSKEFSNAPIDPASIQTQPKGTADAELDLLIATKSIKVLRRGK